MQDRYAGDVGDFGKIGLLRQIAAAGLNIGINWYHTYKIEEHDRADGRHINYFEKKIFQDRDDELLRALKETVEGNRSITSLETANLIPNAQYYSKILTSGSDQLLLREMWHKEALEALVDSDIIFCDPDNGLHVKSVPLKSAKSDKYITESELVSYYSAGKSIIFYNHRCREKEQVYLQRFLPLQQRPEFVDAKWKGLKFNRGTIRDYIFILQPSHFATVDNTIEKMLQSNWNRHFSKIDLNHTTKKYEDQGGTP